MVESAEHVGKHLAYARIVFHDKHTGIRWLWGGEIVAQCSLRQKSGIELWLLDGLYHLLLMFHNL